MLSTIRKTGLPSFWSNEHSQKGVSFGERLSGCVEWVFEKGYDHIIILGNDCPSLATEDILEAHKELASNQLVLGPDERGGAYLIGVSKSTFKKAQFQSLHWQSPSFAYSFHEYARYNLFDSTTLGKKFDLNSVEDLKKNVIFAPWLRISLKEILAPKVRVAPSNDASYTFLLTKSLHRRGPPAIA